MTRTEKIMDKLSNVIESILFISGDGVAFSDIAEKLEVTEKEVADAVKELQDTKYSGDSGLKLIVYNKKAQFSSNPEYATSVSTVLNPIKERNLTRAVLEVAAIIAYKQPVTRLEIENIRGGVNSDYAISTLMDNNMIEVVGRKDAIGKPLLFGTTDTFLKRFDLTSIEDLPDYNELLERIKVIHDTHNNALFNYADYTSKEDEAKISTVDEAEQIRIYNEVTEALANVKMPNFQFDDNDTKTQ